MSLENRQFGRNGGEIINDTDPHAVLDLYMISFYEFTEIAAITITDAEDNDFTGNNLVGQTMPPGYQLFGKVTSIQLTNGACIGYKDGEL